MSQASSSGFKDHKQQVVLTEEDISSETLKSLPLVGCPDCKDHKKVLLLVSGTPAHPGGHFVKCERYKRVYENKTCKFFKWLSDYGLYLEEKCHDVPDDLLHTIQELYRKKVKRVKLLESEVNQESDAVWHCKRLSKELTEEKDLRRKEQLENRAIFQKLEVEGENMARRLKKLEEANGRGWWFSMFLWFLSVCFAMFAGGAMEAGRSN